MMSVTRLIIRAYAILVRRYPPSFRTQFEEEMRQVFVDAVADVKSSNATSLRRGLYLGALCWRELRGALVSLLREHWHDLTAEESTMREPAEINGDAGGIQAIRGEGNEPASWRDAALAGLPHLLMALILGAPGLLRAYGVLAPYTRGIPVSETVLSLGLAGAIVLALIIAWRRGWPRWSASWAAYGLVLAALPVMMLLQNGTTPTALSEAFVSVVTPLALAWFLYRVTRQDWLRGLLVTLPVVTAVWHPVLEFVPAPTRNWVMLSAWAMTALIAASILRLGNLQAGVWLVICASLLVGLPFSYARTYLHNIPPAHASAPTAWGLANRLAPQLIASSTLVIGPLVGRALRELGERSRRRGMRTYHLALLGVLLSLVGNLGSFWLNTLSHVTSYALRPYPQIGGQMFTVMTYLGVLIYLFGSLCLVIAALRKGAPLGRVASVLLILIPLGLPLAIMLNSLHSGWFRTVRANDISRSLIYAAGLAWLLLGGWLVTRPGMRKSPPQAASG